MKIWMKLKMLSKECKVKILRVKGLRLLWLVLENKEEEVIIQEEIDPKDASNVDKKDISQDNVLTKVIIICRGEEGGVEVGTEGDSQMIEDSITKDKTMIEVEMVLDRNHILDPNPNPNRGPHLLERIKKDQYQVLEADLHQELQRTIKEMYPHQEVGVHQRKE